MLKELSEVEMLPSPVASRILSGYAVVFAGVLPAFITLVAVTNGIDPRVLVNLILASAIVYHGARVLFGDRRYIKSFAWLVVGHYVLLAVTNMTLDAPADTRTAHMAGPRTIRNLVYAGIFAWYYLGRKETVAGFVDRPDSTDDQSNA